jgi:hypothetical protein
VCLVVSTFQLSASRAKTVTSCNVVVWILEVLRQKRTGILSLENCNPMYLPGRDGRLGNLPRLRNIQLYHKANLSVLAAQLVVGIAPA